MSDTNFPDEQHKTAFRRLPQAQVLDGGGEWKIVTIAATGFWTCPSGLYEVFVYLTDGFAVCIRSNFSGTFQNYALTASVISPAAGIWLPCSVGETFSSWLQNGVPAPDTQTDAVGSVFLGVTCPRGWILSTGEQLSVNSSISSWFVRFRRVG